MNLEGDDKQIFSVKNVISNHAQKYFESRYRKVNY